MSAPDKIWIHSEYGKSGIGCYSDTKRYPDYEICYVRANRWVSVEPITLARFFSMCDRTDYCWEWTGHKNKYGYGKFRFGKDSILSHRFCFSVIHAIPLEDLDVVAHKCDNPSCINPYHLFHTDNAGNMLDMCLKGRGSIDTSTSKYRGVSWRDDSKKWRAFIAAGGKKKALGCFTDEEDAARAVDEYFINEYGYEAVKNRLNFPDPPKQQKEQA